jgi:competence protein ComEA
MPDAPQTAAVEPTTPSARSSELAATAGADQSAGQTTSVSPDASTNSENETPPAQQTLIDETPRSWLWLTKLDQTFVGVFVAVFLVLSGYHWATLGGWGMRPIEIDRLPERQYDFRIDINSASWVEWTQIDGIGEVTANKIVTDRDSNGPFRTINDLLRVKGIGPKTLEKMRPFLREPSEPSNSRKVAP